MSDGIFFLLIGAIIALYLIFGGAKPAPSASPYLENNRYSINIHTEDNDTNVCIGFCPAR